jgi:DNA polymerase III alpha subunit
MDISRVREKFQKNWNFNILTNYSGDTTQWRYSLQEESLNSDDKLLYITSEQKPSLEGHLLELDNMRWIVWEAIKEHFNRKLWQYLLLPCIDKIVVNTVPVAKNAMGIVTVPDTSEEYELDVYVEDYGLKERTVPTKQPVESFQQVFYIAKYQMPNTGDLYELI